MTTPISKSRYLWAYSAADSWTQHWHEQLIQRRRQRGFDVEPFCVTPKSLNHHWLPFPKLHRLWRRRDPALITMYQQLAERMTERDVLILYNGANLHPDFVQQLGGLKVYTAGDDPESTEVLTRPLAPAFDVHLINNIACVPMYREWGLPHVYFWPLGSLTFEEDVSDLTEELILDREQRDIPIVFFGERESLHRRSRLNRLTQSFPRATCAGRGWLRGFVDWTEMFGAYRRAQLGWNIHNSIGPVNFRTYELAAYGVMQICDNKQTLGELYRLGEEVAGFDSIEECVELTHYYLQHPVEQRRISLNAWRRWKQEYTPDRVWDRLVAILEKHVATAQDAPQTDPTKVSLALHSRSPSVRLHRAASQLRNRIRTVRRTIGHHDAP